MNYIVLGFWVLTALFLVSGALSGLSRGLNRSLWRILLVLLCFVGAIFLKEPFADFVLNIKFRGETLEQMVIGALPQSLSSMGSIFARLLMYPVAFAVVFYLLKFLSAAILYPIGKIFIKKGVKKRGGWGALVGLFQGVAVALCVCLPLGGLAYQADKAFAAIDDLQNSPNAYVSAVAMPAEEDASGETTVDILPDEVQQMLDGYTESVIGKFYGKTCKSAFDCIAYVQTDNGKIVLSDVVTLTKQSPQLFRKVDVVVTALDGVDFSEPSNLNELKAALAELDEAKNNLPKEAKETLNTLVVEVVQNLADQDVGAAEEPANSATQAMLNALATTLAEVNFTDISLGEEVGLMQEVLTGISDITSKQPTKAEVSELLTKMSQSALVLSVCENVTLQDLGIGEVGADVKDAIATQLQEISADNVDTQRAANALKILIGITN